MPVSHGTAGTGPGDAHFAVFPDREDAFAAARSFRRPGTRTLAHASGRPWLVGRWSDQEIVTVRTGQAAHAAVDGIQVAATTADVLASAIGTGPDEEQLAVRLLWPVPYPLFETSLWRGVTAVPPEEALIIAPDGRTARRSRWWTPPEPRRP